MRASVGTPTTCQSILMFRIRAALNVLLYSLTFDCLQPHCSPTLPKMITTADRKTTWIPQLPAGNICIVCIPSIITHSSPSTIMIDFKTSLIRSTSINETCTSCISIQARNQILRMLICIWNIIYIICKSNPALM